jgi:hypothetical protein
VAENASKIGNPLLARAFVRLALIGAITGALSPTVPVANAQGGQCTQACQSSYAQCYKNSGSNRKVCEAQLQQCLSSCIDKR